MDEIERVKAWWNAFAAEKKNRHILLAVGILWLGLLIIVSHVIPVLCVIATILLAVSIKFYQTPWSFTAFVAAVFFYLISTPLTMAGLIVIGMYLVYKFFNSRRIRKIRKVAEMNPLQLSKVKYGKPEVEIIISGGKRK